MNRKHLFIAVALLLLTNQLIVSGASAASCTVSSSGVSFGSFSPLTDTSVDSTGSITVNCTDVSSYTITLSTGSGTYSQRRMVAGGYYLYYNLYRDAAFQQIWGDGISGSSYTVSLTNPVNGQNNLHTIYGRIPLSSQRAAHVGSYSDTTIIVTVSY
jgi:spore coat protein U-like protein